MTPSLFSMKVSIPEKSEIITFEAFWAKNWQNRKFCTFLDPPKRFRHVKVDFEHFDPKWSKNTLFKNFSSPRPPMTRSRWHQMSTLSTPLFDQPTHTFLDEPLKIKMNHFVRETLFWHFEPQNTWFSETPKMTFSVKIREVPQNLFTNLNITNARVCVRVCVGYVCGMGMCTD